MQNVLFTEVPNGLQLAKINCSEISKNEEINTGCGGQIRPSRRVGTGKALRTAELHRCRGECSELGVVTVSSKPEETGAWMGSGRCGAGNGSTTGGHLPLDRFLHPSLDPTVPRTLMAYTWNQR